MEIDAAIARNDPALKELQPLPFFKVHGYSYVNEAKSLLVIKVEKFQQRDVAVTIKFKSDGGFTSRTVRSNTDWLSTGKFFTYTAPDGTVGYKFRLKCPKDIDTCIYQVPKLERSYGVTYTPW